MVATLVAVQKTLWLLYWINKLLVRYARIVTLAHTVDKMLTQGG
jgi:hypothetical protein